MQKITLQLLGKQLFRLQYALVIGCILSSSILRAEDDENENSGSLSIISETAENSAAIYIKEEEQGPVSKEEKEKDKKRKTIGIGERINLTLNGKPQLIGDVSKLQWSITEGEGFAEIIGKKEGSKSIDIDAKKNIASGGQVTVRVEMESGETMQTNLTVVVPSGIEAKHCRKSYDRKHPDFNKRGVSSTTVDGDVSIAGVGAYLELKVNPDNVSFRGIQIMERDKGTQPNPAPTLATVHTPNPNPVGLTDKNRMFDNISSVRTISMLKNHVLPQRWHWVCDWNCHANGQDIFTIRTVNQSFNYGWINQANNTATTTVSKFDRSVSRTTDPNNTQQFN